MTTYAFIDSQNLHKAVKSIERKMDYKRFRLWLERKYNVSCAIMYFGYMHRHKALYDHLRRCGFKLVFREVDYQLGKIKANVDICLTISAMDMLAQYDSAYIVTSDGDFFDLVERWKKDGKFGGIISPQTAKACSTLLRKSSDGKIAFIPELIHKFEDRS